MSRFRMSKPTGTIAWSDGTLFTGFALVGIEKPVTWPSVALSDQMPRRTIPPFAPLPIRDGAFHDAVGVIYNADVTPPSQDYVAYFYDANGVQVAGPTSAFQVSSATFTIPAITLTPPGSGLAPIPDS